MTASLFRVRGAVVGDGAAITTLHIRSWQFAYRGLLPDALLDPPPSEVVRRCAQREQALREAQGSAMRHWVLEREGQVVGWACTGPARDDDLGPEVLELWAIYLAPEWIGRGGGRQLMEHLLGDVAARGCRELVMWVLAGNTAAQRFYRAAGFASDGRVPPQPFRDTGVAKLRMCRRVSAAGGPAPGELGPADATVSK